MAKIDAALDAKVEAVLLKLGAVFPPSVKLSFLAEHGAALVAGADFWEAIDAFRIAHPEGFSSSSIPNLMEKDASGKFIHKDPDAVLTAHTRALEQANRKTLPAQIDLMERDAKGNFVHGNADAVIDDLVRNMRRGAA